jgi:hypothetical protein
MADFPSVPSHGIAHSAAKAAIQDIAVRILTLPEGLRDNPQALRLNGTVLGPGENGGIDVRTDRGVITIVLRDAGSLPAGRQIEIDIPAGRIPQAANIRPAQSAIPGLQPVPPAVPASDLALTRTPLLRPEELTISLDQLAGTARPPASGSLIPGQILRLLPSGDALPVATDTQGILNFFGKVAAQAPDMTPEIHNAYKALLSRLDFSALTAGLPKEAGPKFTPVLQSLGQAFDLPELSASFGIQSIGAASRPVMPHSLPLDTYLNAFSGEADGIPASPQIAMPVQSNPVPVKTGPQSPALFAQVLGFTEAGLPVLALPVSGGIQSYVLQFAARNIQIGSGLILTPIAAPDANGLQNGAAPVDDLLRPGAWSSWQELLDLPAPAFPGREGFLNLLPRADQPRQFGALAALFVAAFRSGDIESLFAPKTLESLRRAGGGAALRSLLSDAGTAGRLESAPLPNDWKAVALPLFQDNQVFRLPVYYKSWPDDSDGNETDARRKVNRFLFALHLSRMGDIQVDGFMRRKNLDTILRTKAPLSVAMQHAVRCLYASAMERSDLTGEIAFQSKPEQFVEIGTASF